MMRIISLLLCGVLLSASLTSAAYADGLEREVGKAFRKIGVGPEQSEAYAKLYEQFLRKRNSQIRRVLNSSSGEQLPVKAKKKAWRSAKKSVKKMAAVLDEQQLKYYEAYLKAELKLFLRESGLR